MLGLLTVIIRAIHVNRGQKIVGTLIGSFGS